MEYEVFFKDDRTTVTVEEGTTILQASYEAEVDIESYCGGRGKCGSCAVLINEKGSPVLACQRHVHCNITVTLAPKTGDDPRNNIILDTGKERIYKFNPAVKLFEVTMQQPSLSDQRDDLARILETMEKQYDLHNLETPLSVIRKLSSVIRNNDFKIKVLVWQNKRILDILPSAKNDIYGIAIDVGTTTLAAFLINLNNGVPLTKASAMNPQIKYGADVISRITFAHKNEHGLETMQTALKTALNELINEMCKNVSIEKTDIYEGVLVFNTVMHHIALGIDPANIGKTPFVSAVADSLDINAASLGIEINAEANIHTLPVQAGFVGADNTSVLLAEEPYNKKEHTLLIDIGTNGEIDFGNQVKMFSTSCATGPALEGSEISFGMRAQTGAIEHVRITSYTSDFEVKVSVIGNTYYNIKYKPLGICGSGIIDVIAEMLRKKIILPSGAFNTEIKSKRLRKNADGVNEFILVYSEDTACNKDIVITQKDIRAIQLAKGALYAGAQILIEKAKNESNNSEIKIDHVVLAGAFGSFIVRENALRIGLFPKVPLKKINVVGNAAGDGAVIALLDKDARITAQKIAKKIHFVETAAVSDFEERFSDAMSFPEYE